MSNLPKRIFKVTGILLAVVLLPILIYVGGLLITTAVVNGYDAYRDVTQWRERTTPLESEVAADMCEKFNLPDDDLRCQPKAVVYAPDFFRTIGETFQPANGDWAIYDEVEVLLGAYKFDQEPITIQSDGTEYFRCWYDLRGDRVYPIVISFYSDGRLWRIIADVTD
jgi:hypothetical protein